MIEQGVALEFQYFVLTFYLIHNFFMVIIIEDVIPHVSFATISACILGNICSGFAVYYVLEYSAVCMMGSRMLELIVISITLVVQQVWITTIPQICKVGTPRMRVSLAVAGVCSYGVYLLFRAYVWFIHSL